VSIGPFSNDLTGLYQRKKGYIPLYDQENAPFGYMFPNSTADVHHSDMYCFQLGKRTYGNDVFLILIPADESDISSPSKFRRVGLGEVRDDGRWFLTDVEVKTIQVI
jgi:hypothetical protein